MKLRKIKLGISACLLGRPVRYDGGTKHDPGLLESFGNGIEWVPVCPEQEAGLTVPREAMRLVQEPGSLRLMTRASGVDHTELLIRWTAFRLRKLEVDQVCGFVLKARSPSCGVHDAEVCAQDGSAIVRRPGLFADALMQHFPLMPVEDEESLRDAAVRARFQERVSAVFHSRQADSPGRAV